MVSLILSLPDTLWVSGSFVKKGGGEEVAGYFYVQPGRKTVLNIVRPIHQIMIFVPETLIIYYPERKRLFYIRSSHSMLSGGIQTSDIGDKNLKKMGFMFLRNERRGDTVVSLYRHPQSKVEVRLISVSGKVVGYRGYGPKGREMVRVDFRGVKEVYEGLTFPSEMVIRAGEGKDAHSETFTYYGVMVVPSSSVPDYVRTFNPPKDVEVMYRGWE